MGLSRRPELLVWGLVFATVVVVTFGISFGVLSLFRDGRTVTIVSDSAQQDGAEIDGDVGATEPGIGLPQEEVLNVGQSQEVVGDGLSSQHTVGMRDSAEVVPQIPESAPARGGPEEKTSVLDDIRITIRRANGDVVIVK